MTQPEIFISLDVSEAVSETALEIKHLESSKVLKIALMDNGLPYEISEGCKAIFVASKPDGTFVINECSIEDDLICYHITSQTSAVTGLVLCEIRLTSENDEMLLTSPRFSIFVTPTIYEGGAVTASQNEFDALSRLTTEANALIEEMKDVLENEVLPPVSTEDDGKFLRVLDGGWRAVTIPMAEEASF